ncbi:hypothetical protein STEG23_036141, partial [Scotinomys teguina]
PDLFCSCQENPHELFMSANTTGSTLTVTEFKAKVWGLALNPRLSRSPNAGAESKRQHLIRAAAFRYPPSTISHQNNTTSS